MKIVSIALFVFVLVFVSLMAYAWFGPNSAIRSEAPSPSEVLCDSITRIDSLIMVHTYGPLDTRYEYGRSEPYYDRKWRITSDSLYNERRRLQNKLNTINSQQ
jgi:hypothetical protein